MSTFCALPWIHLATHPNGAVSLCCVSDHRDALSFARNGEGSQERMLMLGQDSLDQIMNSDSFKLVRQQMLQGQVPAACRRCFREEALGVQSKRLVENARFSAFDESQARAETASDGTIDARFRFVELRLGNRCNMKCRTCNPISSNKWWDDYQKMQKTLPFLTRYDFDKEQDWSLRASVWEELKSRFSECEVLYINGGEPTLIEEHWKFLEDVVTEQPDTAARMTLWYNLNASLLPDRAFPLWKKFAVVRISVSVDDVGERNAYLRSGSQWETSLKNLRKLQNEKWLELGITQTVSCMNFARLPEFWNWAETQSLSIYHNFVNDPEFLGPQSLPLKFRQNCLQQWRQNNALPDSVLRQLELHYSDGEFPVLEQRAREYLMSLDQLRSENISKIYPELEGIFS